MLFWPIFGNFWCPVVTMVTFSSNRINFERIQKNPKIQKNRKKNPKNTNKFPKNPKSP